MKIQDNLMSAYFSTNGITGYYGQWNLLLPVKDLMEFSIGRSALFAGLYSSSAGCC